VATLRAGPLRERGWAEWLQLSRHLTTDSNLIDASIYNEHDDSFCTFEYINEVGGCFKLS
jgi:hypothetical protein